MTRQAKHRKKRREAGKCGYEGCAAETGDRFYYCDCCRARDAARARLRRAKAKAIAHASGESVTDKKYGLGKDFGVPATELPRDVIALVRSLRASSPEPMGWHEISRHLAHLGYVYRAPETGDFINVRHRVGPWPITLLKGAVA